MAKQRLGKIGSVILLLLAAIFLFLAQSAYWINHTIFNQQNFTNTATSTLLTDTNRQAIATAVVDKALENRPIIKRVAGDRATSLVSGLLGTDLSSQAINALVSKTYAYTTSSDRKDIAIDLTAIKTPISLVVGLADQAGVNTDAINQITIPDQIVLLRSNAVPDLSGVVRAMLLIGPLFWLSSIALFAVYIYIGRKNYAKRVYIAGAVICVVALWGLFTNPFIPPQIAAYVPNIALRPVAESMAHAFLAPFLTQMEVMLFVTLGVLLIFNQRFNILRGSKVTADKLTTILAKKSAPAPTKKSKK